MLFSDLAHKQLQCLQLLLILFFFCIASPQHCEAESQDYDRNTSIPNIGTCTLLYKLKHHVLTTMHNRVWISGLGCMVLSALRGGLKCIFFCFSHSCRWPTQTMWATVAGRCWWKESSSHWKSDPKVDEPGNSTRLWPIKTRDNRERLQREYGGSLSEDVYEMAGWRTWPSPTMHLGHPHQVPQTCCIQWCCR